MSLVRLSISACVKPVSGASSPQLREQGRQLLLVPSALDFVECHVELAFLRLVEVYHRHVHLCLPLIFEDGEPLVAAHYPVRPLIPDDGDNHAIGDNAPAQVLILGIAGDKVYPGVIGRPVEIAYLLPHYLHHDTPFTTLMIAVASSALAFSVFSMYFSTVSRAPSGREKVMVKVSFSLLSE